MLPDFNRLKIFYYIYAGQSIVAAAKVLNITQSAVSQHLKKLESEIKTPLFTRLHKRLVPTAEAERLFAIIKPFLQDLEAGLRSIKGAKVKPAGNLRIGAPAEFGKAYFPGVIASFRQKYPEVTFSLTLGGPSILLPMVDQGELDFALVDLFLTQQRFHGGSGNYHIEPVVDEEVILAGSKIYFYEVLKEDVSYENLINQTFISYHAGALALRSWFKHHFGKTSVKLDIVMTVDSVQAVVGGLEQHTGLGIVASHFVYEDIGKGLIVPIATNRETIINRISLVQLLDKKPTLTEKTFHSHFKHAMQQTDVLKRFAKITEAR